jgi:hypothetical protein
MAMLLTHVVLLLQMPLKLLLWVLLRHWLLQCLPLHY